MAVAEQEPARAFVESVGAGLDYWQRQLEAEVDLEALDRERHNLFRAVQLGLALPGTQAAAIDVVLSAFPFVRDRGSWRGWVPVLQRALDACAGGASARRFRLLTQLGLLQRWNFRPAQAIATHQQALALAQEMEDSGAAATACCHLGYALQLAHRHEEAEQQAQAARALLQQTAEDRPRVTAEVFLTLATVARDQGQFETAIAYYHQALGAWRRVKDERLVAGALQDLAEAYRLAQRPQEALRCFAEAAQLLAESGDVIRQSQQQYSIGALHFSRDAWAEAEAAFRAIDLPYLHQTGNVHLETIVLTALGNAVLYQGRCDEAVNYLRRALGRWQQLGDRLEIANATGSLGEALAAGGKYEEAAALLGEALALLEEFPEHVRAERLRALFRREWDKLVAG